MNRLQMGTASRRLRYVLAATLVRSLDAGATVGLVLIALASDDVSNPVSLGATLGAALTLPHLLGPWTARLLDVLPDPRWTIALAAVWFAVALAVLASGIGRMPLMVLLVIALTAGAAGPILTGGLSSQVAATVGSGRSTTSVDALTYGLSATLAPALVATLATVVGPVPATVALSVLGLAGGAAVCALPRPASGAEVDVSEGEASRAGVVTVARTVFGDRDLRLVVALTWFGAFLVAAALILALAGVEEIAPQLSGQVATGLGAGGLLGAALLIRWPPRVAARRGLMITTALLSGCCLIAGLVPGAVLVIGTFFLLGLLSAPHTVFSLAAREELPPPELRRQVFVAVAGTKVAFSSLGTALAGLLVHLGPSILLIGLAGAGAVVTLLCLAAGRRRSARRKKLVTV